MEQSLWGHLPLLMRSNSKDSIEYILQALWRTRHAGLDSADRHVILNMLQLHNDSDLDPLLVCLRMLIRRYVYENISKDDVPKLFPPEVLPELQRLLALLLQKFQREWQEDVLKDQNSVPRLKAMTWNMANPSKESTDPAAVVNLKLQNDSPFHLGELDVKFLLAKDTVELMLKSMHSIKDQHSSLRWLQMVISSRIVGSQCNCFQWLSRREWIELPFHQRSLLRGETILMIKR